MKKQYKLICMSFDGDYVTEALDYRQRPFDSIAEAWNYSCNMGSRWFFYPFHFVVSGSGKTIMDAPEPLEWINGMKVKTVQAVFNAASKKPEAQNMDVDEFIWFI